MKLVYNLYETLNKVLLVITFTNIHIFQEHIKSLIRPRELNLALRSRLLIYNCTPWTRYQVEKRSKLHYVDEGEQL